MTDRRPTTRKVRVVGEQQQLLRLDYEQTTAIDDALEDRSSKAVGDALGGADIVVISDYAKGVVTRRVCLEVLAKAQDAGKQVIIHPRPQHRSFYVGCDYLTPNWKESQALPGILIRFRHRRRDCVQRPRAGREVRVQCDHDAGSERDWLLRQTRRRILQRAGAYQGSVRCERARMIRSWRPWR